MMRLLGHRPKARTAATGDGLTADLLDWEFEHAEAGGDVWMLAAVGRDWALYGPGGVNHASNDPLWGVTPWRVRYNEVGRRQPRLRRLRRWLVPWVEEVTLGAVQECAEGLSWYGPRFSWARYVVYLRVDRRSTEPPTVR
jgi:hypothetical protein